MDVGSDRQGSAVAEGRKDKWKYREVRSCSAGASNYSELVETT